MTKRFLGILLAIGMVLNLVYVPTLAAEEVVTRGYKTLDIDFEGEEWVINNDYASGHANWPALAYIGGGVSYTIKGDESTGKYITFDGSASNTLFGIQGFSQKKFTFKFDMMSSTGNGFDVRTRRITPVTESVPFRIASNKAFSKDFLSDTWYTLKFTFDLVNETYRVEWHDADGALIHDTGEVSFPWGDFTSFTHLRMVAGSSAGTISIDNLEVYEWLEEVQIGDVYDSEGSSDVDYGTKTLVAQMIGDTVAEAENVFVKEKNSDKTISVTKAEADSQDATKLHLTLGGKLSAGTEYSLVFDADTQIVAARNNDGAVTRTALLGEPISKDFTTTLTTFMPTDEETPDTPTGDDGTVSFDISFDGEEWEAGKSYSSGNSNWPAMTFVDSTVHIVAEEEGKGKVLTFEGGQNQANSTTIFGIQSFSQDKFSLKFDLKSTGATSFDFRMRRTSPTNEPQMFKIADQKFFNKDFLADTWYSLEFIFDLIDETYRVIWTDSEGELIHDTGEVDYPWGAYTSATHFRLFAYIGAGTISIDNFKLTEWIKQPEIVSVTDAQGNSEVDFNGNQIVVKTTKRLIPDEEYISVKRVIDGSDISITDAVLDSNDNTKLVLTLGTPLQSASKYDVTLKEGLKMYFREAPVTADVKYRLETAARPEGDMTDVKFSPNKSLGVVSYKADLINPSDVAKTIMLLISVYDEDGRLVKTEKQIIDLATGEELTTPVKTVNVPKNGSVKVFALGDLTTFAPLNNNIYTYSFK